MKSKAPQKKDAVKKQLQNGAVEKRKSKYVGVSWHVSHAKYGVYGKWKVQINHQGKQRTVDYFPADKEKQAAKCYDAEARKLRGPKAKLNFPRAGEAKGTAVQRRTAEQRAADRALGGVRKSKYVGVSWSSASGKWHATLTHKGVSRSLGYFPADKEKEAAQCYDKVARKLRGKKAKVNFPRARQRAHRT